MLALRSVRHHRGYIPFILVSLTMSHIQYRDLIREESLSSKALRSASLADSNISQAIKVRKPCCTCSTNFTLIALDQ
jgi:hypothetical protein